MNIHAERSAGWSVLCFVVLTVGSIALFGQPPDVATAPSVQAAFMTAHRTAILWSAWLTFPAAGFFLWFLVGLRSFLRKAPGPQEGLPAFAFGAGIVLTAVAFLTAFLQTALAYVPPTVYVADGLSALYAAFVFATTGLGWAPLAIFLFAAAHSMRRHGSVPPGLAMLGYFAAFTAAVAAFSIFFSAPMLSPTGRATVVLGAVPATLWFVGVGIALLRIKESPASS
jgi:hypothetical protein